MSGSSCKTTKIYAVSFTIWTLTTTYETWPTQHERVGSVETPVLFFAVCGPKFTELSKRAQDGLQFSTPFSFRRYLVPFRRYSRSSCMRGCPKYVPNFDVYGPPNCFGEDPKFLTWFLPLARYVPNVAKRSIWDSVRRSIIYIEDRPATSDQRPTNDRPLNFENFKWPYLREGSSDPLHVWFYVGVFEVGGSNGAIFGFAKSKMAARKWQYLCGGSSDLRRLWF